MAPQDGFEPPTGRLTAACSAAELPGNTVRLDTRRVKGFVSPERRVYRRNSMTTMATDSANETPASAYMSRSDICTLVGPEPRSGSLTAGRSFREGVPN
jgi:hypothetical protein